MCVLSNNFRGKERGLDRLIHDDIYDLQDSVGGKGPKEIRDERRATLDAPNVEGKRAKYV
jgi:hypothetical protein